LATYQKIGRYELLSKLATGGMGEIFLARLAGEGGFEKLIVLKRLLPELVASEHFVAMFLDEARIAAKLSHPNVCEVYELGNVDGQYFIAMQYLEGVPFTEAMRRDDAGDETTFLTLVASSLQQACEGLHHAHELTGTDGELLQLVHRDVSPSNLFVTTDGQTKVLDFGIAKARGATSQTEQGMIKGKYAYMSPEQVRGEELDRRSDVFALGIVLFEAITGTRLFKRDSDYLVAKAILEEPIPRADAVRSTVPEALADVTARALARDRDERWASARELGAAVAAALEPMPAVEIGAVVRRRFADELSTKRAEYEAASALAEAATLPLEAPTRYIGPPRTASRRRGLAVALFGLVAIAAVAAVWAMRAGNAKPAEPLLVATAPVTVDAGTRPVVTAIAFDAAPARTIDAAAAPRKRAGTEPPRKAPPPKRGFISIDSDPYATIYVDGRRAGVTPLIEHSVRAGRRRVRAVLKSGREKRFHIDVEPGKVAPGLQLSW
jgi:serine/threonine-protein kinase